MDFLVCSKGLRLVTKVSSRVPEAILTDGKRYKQIIYNLVGNAIKYTFEGQITISVDYHPSGQLITSIADTGIGIKQEERKGLFKLFGQAAYPDSSIKSGMGFGLTLSKMILQELGGEISIKSKPRKGSTFTFRIPVQKVDH
jgi:signal transduction histidine kinase